MLWAMLCEKTVGPGTHADVNLTYATYLNIAVDQANPFMVMLSLNVSGLFQQDNVTCHTAYTVQEWFDEHVGEFKVLSWPPNSPHLNTMCWNKKSDTTGHL